MHQDTPKKMPKDCQAASIAPLRWRCSRAWNLENERGQLIERVNDLDAHENERCDHQIEAKMHERFETKKLPLARADLAKAVNQIQYASERASGPVNSVSATGRLPPPRK